MKNLISRLFDHLGSSGRRRTRERRIRQTRRAGQGRRLRALGLEPLEARLAYTVSPIGFPVEVAPPAGAETSADTAMFADGSFVTSYLKGGEIFVSHFDVNKQLAPFGNAPLRLQVAESSYGYGGSIDSTISIATASRDAYVVAYAFSSNDPYDIYSGREYQVHVAKVSLDPISGQYQLQRAVAYASEKYIGGVQVDMDDAGNFVVMWQESFSSQDQDLYFMKVNSEFQSSNSQIGVVGALTSAYEQSGEVGLSADGTRLVFAWRVNSVPFVTLYDNSSAIPQVIEAQISPKTLFGSDDRISEVDVAIDDDGDSIIAWVDTQHTNRVLYRQLSRSGEFIGEPQVIPTTGNARDVDLAVGDFAEDQFVISYTTGNDVWVAGKIDGLSFNRAVASTSASEWTGHVAMEGGSFVVDYRKSDSRGTKIVVQPFGNRTEQGRHRGSNLGGFASDFGSVWIGLESLGYGQLPLENIQVGAWSTQVGWRTVLSGDFDGDGTPEVVGMTDAGQWWRSTSLSSPAELWTTWTGSLNWTDIAVLDVNGDGKDDIVGRWQDGGQWWIAESTGASFVNRLGASWSPDVNWLDSKVADLNGDGRMDIVSRTHYGQWWAGISNGSTFQTQLWGAWAADANWQNVSVGDVDGDGREDLAGRSSGGNWWVARSTGSGFVNEFWGWFSPEVNWQNITLADVDGDGRDDVVGSTSGFWWVGKSTGQSFTNSSFGYMGSTNWQDVRFGDFNLDGRREPIGRHPSTGIWYAGLSTGASFGQYLWGVWNPEIDWKFVQVF